MSDLPTAVEIETRAKNAGLSMRETCIAAGVSQSTFSRWKANATTPNLGTLTRLAEAIGAAEAARRSDAVA
jgi:transcriptional regulator with XRE-family HTH domain